MRKIQKKVVLSEGASALFEQTPLPFGAYQPAPSRIFTNAWEGKKGWWSPRRWRRKAWVFYGVYAPELIAGMAIVDAGYMAKAFCYVYLPASGYYFSNEESQRFGFPADFDAATEGTWQFGAYQLKRTAQYWTLQYEGKSFEMTLKGQENTQGLGFLCPSRGKERPFHYTYKNMLLPTQVSLHTNKLGARTWEQLPGAVDYSKGFPPRKTEWHWASFQGKLANGTPFGCNAVRQFNNGLENALWIGGEQYALGTTQFKTQKPIDQQPWEVTADGLELQLTPWGARKEKTNYWLLSSQFTQVYGKGEGRLFYKDEWHPFRGYGVLEKHKARW